MRAKLNLQFEHVLLRCQTWNAIRANYFTVTNLSDLFSNVTSRCIVDFIKEIGFYSRKWSPYHFLSFIKEIAFYLRIWSTSSFHFYHFYHLSSIFFVHCLVPLNTIQTIKLYSFWLILSSPILGTNSLLCWCAVKHHTNKQTNTDPRRSHLTARTLVTSLHHPDRLLFTNTTPGPFMTTKEERKKEESTEAIAIQTVITIPACNKTFCRCVSLLGVVGFLRNEKVFRSYNVKMLLLVKNKHSKFKHHAFQPNVRFQDDNS